MLGTGDAGVLLQEKGLDVPLSNGQTAYFNYYWLRDNCPSSFDPETRERVNDIFALDEAPRAASAAIVGGDLEIAWAGTNDVSRLPLSLLSAYSAGEKRPDIANLPREPWYGDHYAKMARFSYDEVMEDTGRRRDWARAMLTDAEPCVVPTTNEALRLATALPAWTGTLPPTRGHRSDTNGVTVMRSKPG